MDLAMAALTGGAFLPLVVQVGRVPHPAAAIACAAVFAVLAVVGLRVVGPAAGEPAARTPGFARTTTWGSALTLDGVLAEFVATAFHPSHEPPNDRAAAFAEYHQSQSWIVVHLAQFLTGIVFLTGLLVLLPGCARRGRPGC